MSYKWKQIKNPEAGDEKYHKSYQQNYIIEKMFSTNFGIHEYKNTKDNCNKMYLSY